MLSRFNDAAVPHDDDAVRQPAQAHAVGDDDRRAGL